MARIESDKLEGEAFKSSEETFCRFFHVENLHEEQLHALRAFFEGKDVYFSAGTGYGKSLVFQAIPLLHDRLVKQVICTSIGIIICPLISLMLDEVAYLQYLGINVASIYADQDPKILEDVENGTYSHVYASPESMLSVQRWRSMIQPPTFQEHCLLVSVNEAHCISQWWVLFNCIILIYIHCYRVNSMRIFSQNL